IPTVFVIDKMSRIAWIGDPSAELDEVLEPVLQGTFNAQAAAKLRDAKQIEYKRIQSEINRAASICQSGRIRQGLAILDRLIDSYPDQTGNIQKFKFGMLAKVDEPEAYRLAKVLGETVFRNDAQVLNQIAWH